MTWPKEFTDPTGRYIVGGQPDSSGTGFCVQDIHRQGEQIGVYIDDTTPNLEGWLRKAVAAWPHGLVFVGIPDGEPHLRYGRFGTNVINLQEWYPYGGPWSWRSWGPPPRCEGYIIQWNLPGLDANGNVVKGPPPTARQRRRLLRWVKMRGAKYVFYY